VGLGNMVAETGKRIRKRYFIFLKKKIKYRFLIHRQATLSIFTQKIANYANNPYICKKKLNFARTYLSKKKDMVNTSKIQFSKSAITALTVLDEGVQNTVLASIMRAISAELSTSNLKSTPVHGDTSYYSLRIGDSFRVVLKFEKDFIVVKNIFTNEMIEYFQRESINA
jgi:mRNA-degrading endonuclease RelE of RelBE toxin-antitoxin system